MFAKQTVIPQWPQALDTKRISNLYAEMRKECEVQAYNSCES